MRYRLKFATWTVVREPGARSPHRLNDQTAVAALARDLLRDADDDREHFWTLYLNAQNRLLFAALTSLGTISGTLVHPREVLGPALREGAAAVILVHNHPSGDPMPSREDIRLTHQIRDVAEVHDIRLHDHVVIGNGTERFTSMAAAGLL
jgi:DNA repair protein RadC